MPKDLPPANSNPRPFIDALPDTMKTKPGGAGGRFGDNMCMDCANFRFVG